MLPKTVIYDPELTITLPVKLSITSGINAIAHAAEGLYARETNPVMSLMAEESIRALASGLPGIRSNPQAIAARGITIIVIEHLMRVVTWLAQQAIVLHHGAVVSEGPTDQVFRDPRVIEAYLGNRFAERFAKASTLMPLEI